MASPLKMVARWLRQGKWRSLNATAIRTGAMALDKAVHLWQALSLWQWLQSTLAIIENTHSLSLSNLQCLSQAIE